MKFKLVKNIITANKNYLHIKTSLNNFVIAAVPILRSLPSHEENAARQFGPGFILSPGLSFAEYMN